MSREQLSPILTRHTYDFGDDEGRAWACRVSDETTVGLQDWFAIGKAQKVQFAARDTPTPTAYECVNLTGYAGSLATPCPIMRSGTAGKVELYEPLRAWALRQIDAGRRYISLYILE